MCPMLPTSAWGLPAITAFYGPWLRELRTHVARCFSNGTRVCVSERQVVRSRSGVWPTKGGGFPASPRARASRCPFSQVADEGLATWRSRGAQVQAGGEPAPWLSSCCTYTHSCCTLRWLGPPQRDRHSQAQLDRHSAPKRVSGQAGKRVKVAFSSYVPPLPILLPPRADGRQVGPLPAQRVQESLGPWGAWEVGEGRAIFPAASSR